jgi:hypothetical protein
MPKVRTVGDIKTNLLHPALTSHFEVTIPKPAKFTEFLTQNNFPVNSVSLDQLNLLCSETVLPGSNLATLEINSDHTGVTERHAYRRIYDDRIDFTFYVDAVNYLPIIYFESWIKFIVDESIKEQEERGNTGTKHLNYFYRARYPNDYMCEQGLTVTKFERTGRGNSYGGSTLTYEFINAFPISVSSIPVSYDSSSLLKCTVSFSYIRYYITSVSKTLPPNVNPTPGNSAQFNTDQFKGIQNDTFSTSDSSKTPGLNNFVETQEQYYNRIYGES